MASAVFHISLDIDDAFSQASMSLCQGESGRFAAISLRQSGKAFPVDDCRVVCAGTRPDGQVFFMDCSVENGLILCPFSAVHTACPGTVRAEIRLYGSGDVLIASPAFELEIRESAMSDGPVADGAETTALTALISDALDTMAAMEDSAVTAAELSIDGSTGQPYASVELIPGEKGQTLRLAFSGLKGEKGRDGEKGETGKDGYSPVKGVDYFDGADGKDGADGAAGQNGADGKDGADGFSPTVKVSKSGNVTTLTITDREGTKTAAINDGEDGKDGAPGADGAPGKDGADGKDGHTPVKGVDYFDGADGRDGADGLSVFSLNASSLADSISVTYGMVENEGRKPQIGDLLLATPTGRMYKIFDLDDTYIFCNYTGLTVKGEGGGGNGGSGGGADVLSDAGIIKQEHLPEGYPYPLKSGGAILPETIPMFAEDMGAFVIMDGIDASMFAEGESYTVNWNGTEYKTSALAVNDDGMEAIILGDAGALQGVPVSGEPFMIMILSAEAQAAMGVASMIMSIDGSETVILSISSDEIIVPISHKYLPDGYPYIIPGGAVLLADYGISDVYNGPLLFNLKSGYNYSVNWNGTEYPVTAINTGEMVYIGNLGGIVEGTETEEPFAIMAADGQMIVSGTFPATFTVTTADSYKKIDLKYLPDDLNLVVDITPRNTVSEILGRTTGFNHTVATFSTSLQKIKESLSYGAAVRARVIDSTGQALFLPLTQELPDKVIFDKSFIIEQNSTAYVQYIKAVISDGHCGLSNSPFAVDIL